MIVVIADDLTGAAELGGIALRYGLSVQISFDVSGNTTADVLIVNSDTRSMPVNEAVKVTERLCRQIKAMQPDITFKKVDSVLRGHVIPELEAQLKAFGKRTAVLLPANPALGRTIENGVYLVYGKPIAETGFGEDPEFPISSSLLVDMLPSQSMEVIVQKAGPTDAHEMIVVGEVANERDLKDWADNINDSLVIAGGAGFFRALLKSRGLSEASGGGKLPLLQGTKLYICGTAFESSAHRVASLAGVAGLVHYLPDSMLKDQIDPDDVMKFAESMKTDLEQNLSLILAVRAGAREGREISALELRERTALIVKAVCGLTQVDELIIEGGSTASAVLRSLNIKQLVPALEYAPGVIRCQAGDKEDLFVTLKPGSYNWPREVWMF